MIRSKNILILFLGLLFSAAPGYAQNELQPVKDGTEALRGLLGEEDNTITSVRLVSSGEQALTVSVEFKGYQDKAYYIVGNLLSRSKRPLEEIAPVKVELPKQGNAVDLSFSFQPKRNYNRTYLESYFLSLSVAEADGLFSGMEDLLGGVSVTGDDYTYELEKKWRIGGNEQMVIEVKLTPVGAARTIKP